MKLSYDCKILADSISPDLIRLTTYEITFPRFILAELNTHRMFSRNSASSRAIPSEKIIQRVMLNPFVPQFNKRVKGMGVGDLLAIADAKTARDQWLQARNDAVRAAETLLSPALDVDKSRVNRLLEPFMWHTAIVTATEWSNFFALRTDEGAQPEFRKLALMMQAAYEDNQPTQLRYDQWHLPLVHSEEMYPTDPNWDKWKKVSVGRCARVSYLTHDGKRDPQADIDLHDRLMTNGHLSPFEHVARPITDLEYHELGATGWSGNFRGFHQYRKDIPFEHDFAQAQEAAAC